ncbi:MAG: hypothetical protein AAFX55_17720 [Bacteroidota bacterium]
MSVRLSFKVRKSSENPSTRKLRGYAFDPSLSIQMDTVGLNTIIYEIEWEDLATSKHFDIKNNTREISYPLGEYIEIIDYDPASELFYPPIDLNDPLILAENGLNPDVSNPQFHQQMVYAIIMTTIKNFEKALGRKIQWSERLYRVKGNNRVRTESEFVGRLRVYPHALRQPNAYYDSIKKSLLFGYFPATPANASLQLPGSIVFTCLSHDIIAHETTHAILDGLHSRYIEPTHPDTRAFHEAFADLVALFQHFTFPEVLEHQIAKTRGDLSSENLLGQLAQEFGQAVGHYGSLRDAIGQKDKDGWRLQEATPEQYANTFGFHKRGSILVSAVFEAFVNIYHAQTRRIMRIATGGSGVLSDGELHPDLVHDLSKKASQIAGHVLRICIRALDFCPPLDITFGDYLRAIITADRDLVPKDDRNYRVAFIEAFQKRGIFPSGLKSMSEEVLAYEDYPDMGAGDSLEAMFVDLLKSFQQELSYVTDRRDIYKLSKKFIGSGGLYSTITRKFLQGETKDRFSELTGILFPDTLTDAKKLGIKFSSRYNHAVYAVDKIWLANRVSPMGKVANHVIITLQQRRGVIGQIVNDQFKIKDFFNPDEEPPANGFVFRGGCTLIFDLNHRKLKYAIKKAIDDKDRIEQQFRYQTTKGVGVSTYFDEDALSSFCGPFAFMHSFSDQHENL